MASIRNFTAEDNGVRWDLSFEWFPDGGNDPGTPQVWTLWEGQIPRDLDDLDPNERDGALFTLSQAIAMGQGVPL